MKLMHWVLGPAVVVFVLLVSALPATGDVLVGAGPNIGLFDIADGHHSVGLYAGAMWHFRPDEGTASVRLDGSYSRFWAEGDVGNEDFDVLKFVANLVITFSQDSSTRPYWTLGVGYAVFPDESEFEAQDVTNVVFGTGFGARFGWGIIEGRFDLVDTGSGLGAHVPIFAALSF